MNQAGERLPNITDTLGVSVLLPRLHHARTASGAHLWPGQRGEKWGTGHGGSHRSRGKRGVHEQEGQILSVHSSDSLWVRAEEQAQAGLSSWKAASTRRTDTGIC